MKTLFLISAIIAFILGIAFMFIPVAFTKIDALGFGIAVIVCLLSGLNMHTFK